MSVAASDGLAEIDRVNSPDYWNRRFLTDWSASGGSRQTEFFAALCCLELPRWFVEQLNAAGASIFDYGCALGDALPVLQRTFPRSTLRGGDVAGAAVALARQIHSQFEFVDLGAVEAQARLGDVIFCSNTLEHLLDWREVLARLAGHAKDYVLIMVPFEEEELLDEHVAVFEFDTLPPALPGGMRLLHLGVVNAAREPQSQWDGLQLIAIYGRQPEGAHRAVEEFEIPSREGSWVFDLRDAASAALRAMLAGMAAISRGRREMARAPLRQYAELTRGFEEAQRWIIGELTALDPALTVQAAPAADWPTDADDGAAAHRAARDRLYEAINRANRLAMEFHDQAARLLAENARLRRECDEAAAGHERARRRLLELERYEPVGQSRTAGPVLSDGAPVPLISIVLPVYNHGYLIDEAIEAVRAQTYRNWELIVVDDGSTDDLETLVRAYRNDRRILFLRQSNQKLPAALNHGFSWARGEFLTWTSADNVMLPHQAERLACELMAHPEAGLVYSDYWAIDDRGEPYQDPAWRPHNRAAGEPGLICLPNRVTIDNFHRSGDNFIGASFLYRRAVAEIVGRYADGTFGGEDYDFWLRLHLATPFRHVPEPLYKYRVHPDTLNARAAELRLFDNIRELREADRWRIATLLAEHGLRESGSDPHLPALRPSEQFDDVILRRCRPVLYRRLVENGVAADEGAPLVVDVDVPPRLADEARLRDAAILLCRSELAAALLRQQDYACGKRVLVWEGEPNEAVRHAFVQVFAEQATAPSVAHTRREAPRVDPAFRPSRILLLVDRWSSGGLENVAVDLARSLAAEGCTAVLAAADGEPPPAAALAGSPVRTLSFGGKEAAFADFVRREAIEVVNYHHSRFAAVRARKLGAATVYTMHNCYLWMNESQRHRLAADLKAMDRVIAVSRQVAQFAAAQFGVAAERIAVVPNGLSDEALAAAEPARLITGPGTPFTIALIASLVGHKLQHVAIAAFEDVARDDPDLRLRLIGASAAPEYRKRIEAQIAGSPVRERIDMAIGLPRREAIARLGMAQVFLLPSLLEGCSMALLEAASAGCVCIASDVGNARDLCLPGGSVVLVPSPLGELDEISDTQFFAAAEADLPEHRANIAEALRRVRRDYETYVTGIKATRDRVLALHSMARMTRSCLEAYTVTCRGGARLC